MHDDIINAHEEVLGFDERNVAQSIIKVIGVGGGGGNAVDHMYTNGIHDVTFLQCNTDSQALSKSPVPVRLQLGKEGLGAGNKPEKGRAAALESIEDIKNILSDGTRMTFITAGMGGGTGTGAAPIIAKASKELGILTVGIVTIPFLFEGEPKIDKALDGVEELSKYVDALLVINNERLRQLYGELELLEAYAKANEILNIAAKSIAEIITKHGTQNLDFNDVCTVLKDGGVAVMSTGYGEGEGRVKKAIDDALNSPLLNDNDIFNSKRILLNLNFSGKTKEGGGLLMDEMSDIHEFMERFKTNFEIKWGWGVEDGLGTKVKITILATGFGLSDVDGMEAHIDKRLTAEQEEKKRQEEEKKIKNDNRRDQYYRRDLHGGKAKRAHNVYLFSLDDLDNDEVIYAVEATPTASRSRRRYHDICDLTKSRKKEPSTAAEAETAGQQMISFS